MNTRFQFGPIRDEEDSHTLCRIAAQTFNYPFDQDLWQNYVSLIELPNFRIARQDNDIIGGLAVYRVQQWFGGRAIPMAAIALVCVVPELRGSGVARFLLSETLSELKEEGVPLSVLYASTQRPYRQAGYEQAGSSYVHKLSMAHIGPCDPGTPLTQLPREPNPLLEQLADQRAKSGNGHLQRSPGMWRRLFDQRTATAFCYVMGEQDDPEGYFIVAQDHDPATNERRLIVRDVVAQTPAAATSFWAFVYGHRPIFDHVQWYGPATDPLLLLPSEEQATVVNREHWMLRVVDVHEALTARGYPQHVTGELHFEIEDPLLPSNAGRWVLSVASGRGILAEGGQGDIQLHVRSLAPLFSGMFAASDLRGMGMLRGSDSALELATQLFQGAPPWMADRF